MDLPDDRPTESHEDASARRDRYDELGLELEGVRAELAEALARLAKRNQERQRLLHQLESKRVLSRAMPAGPEPFGPGSVVPRTISRRAEGDE